MRSSSTTCRSARRARPGSGNSVVRAHRQGLADLGHHAVPIGTSARDRSAPRATCRTPGRATRISIRPSRATSRINGDYGDGDVLGANPPSYIDRNAFVSPAAFTYGNTPRTLAFGLRNPDSFNQDLSVRRDFRIARDVEARRSASTCSTCSTMSCSAASRRNITNANFGRVSSQTNTPRVGQIKMRFEF